MTPAPLPTLRTIPTRIPAAATSRLRSLGAAYAAVGNHAPGFDTLRVAAASAVVFHHAMALEYDVVRDDRLYAFSAGYTTLGFFAVSIFFCLSGYLVTPGLARNGDVLDYLSRRFMRIMPLLTVVVAGTVLVLGPLATQLPLNAYFTDPRTWLYFRNVTTSLSLGLPGAVNQTGGDAVNGALWTLRYEWLCYLALAALAAVHLLRRRWVLLLLWAAALGVTFVLRPQATAVETPQWQMLLHLFAYFGAGSLLYLYRERLPVSPLLMVGAGGLLAASLWFGLGALLAPPLTAYLVAGLGLVRWPWSRQLARADTSFGIYLLHGPVIVLILAYYRPGSFVILFLLAMLLTVPLALVSWLLVEAPSLRHKQLPAAVLRRAVRALKRGRLR